MSAYTDAELNMVHDFAWQNRDNIPGSGSREGARQLLDAIAPAIAARALREAAEHFHSRPQLRATDYLPKRAADYIGKCADEIERGES